MRTISQVAELTGISIRTLQYYDEIGLLKPSELTQSGYRLYNDEALQKLQQILFFKELGFKLKDIDEILQKPDFDRIAAFRKQKELLLLKRNRTDRLIQLLSRLEKGEQCMSFKEFDLSDYINALEDFKSNSTDEVIKHWGSVENFDMFIQKIKDDEAEVAKLAIQQFGSIEKYTEAMKYNLEHFSEIEERIWTEEAKQAATYVGQQTDLLYTKLTADLSQDIASPQIQGIVHSIILLFHDYNDTISDNTLINALIDTYSSDYMRCVTDNKYGKEASDYIIKALRYYSENNTPENN